MCPPAVAAAVNDILAGSEHSNPIRWLAAVGRSTLVVGGERYMLVIVGGQYSLLVVGRRYTLVVVIRVAG